MKHVKLTISVLLIVSICLSIIGCTDKQKISRISVDKFNDALIDFMDVDSDDISESDTEDQRELSCTPSELCVMVITEYNKEYFEELEALGFHTTNMYELFPDIIRINYTIIEDGIPFSGEEVEVETITHRFEEDYGYIVFITSDEDYLNYAAPNREGIDRMLYAGYYVDSVMIEIHAFDGDIDKALEFIEYLDLPSL